MNVLLKIGHQELLLPNSTGTEHLLKILSRAVKVYDRRWDEAPRIEVELEPLKVLLEFLPPDTKFVQEKTSQPVEVWSRVSGKKLPPAPPRRLLHV